MRARFLVVGEAPRPGDPYALPLSSGRSAERLARLCGLRRVEDLQHHFGVLNVFERWTGTDGKGSAFCVARARDQVKRLEALGMFQDGDSAILLGTRVARAFRVKLAYLVWGALPSGCRVAVAPHPSGVNMWWNDPRNVRRATRFWRKQARGG